ncbi:MAG: hypothetical protein ACPIOQ_37655, partial [Promethearchaeia archaeon]
IRSGEGDRVAAWSVSSEESHERVFARCRRMTAGSSHNTAHATAAGLLVSPSVCPAHVSCVCAGSASLHAHFASRPPPSRR